LRCFLIPELNHPLSGCE